MVFKKNNKEMGGFIEFYLQKTGEYHNKAYKINLARHSFNFLAKANNFKKLYIPKYISNTVYDNLNIPYEFYDIDENFCPILDRPKSKQDALVYVNYFGVNNENVKKLLKKFPKIIIDNAHAFYNKIKNQNTLYSARKFFGVSDGCYFYSKKKIKLDHLNEDLSYLNLIPLLKKIELGSNKSYLDYLNVESKFNKSKIKKMSLLTSKILNSIDYQSDIKHRLKSFKYLHSELGKKNELSFSAYGDSVPMCYPFLNKKNNISNLIKNKFYVPRYYKSSQKFFLKNSFENYLIDKLVCIPIHKNINRFDLKYILNLINA